MLSVRKFFKDVTDEKMHHFLGFSPVRTGGMIMYSIDIAEAKSMPADVSILLLGEIAQCVFTGAIFHNCAFALSFTKMNTNKPVDILLCM